MPDNVLDTVAFQLQGDIAPLKASYAAAEAETDKLAASIKGKTAGAFDGATDSLEKLRAKYAAAEAETNKLAASIKGKTAGAFDGATDSLEKLRAKYDTAFASQQKFSKAQSELNALVAAGVMSEKGAADAMKALTTATGGGHMAASTATREFRALFDELSSGRTHQTPGTLAIIATRVFGLSLSTIAWGVAIAAIPVAFAAAAISAENSLAKIRTALVLTGNATGATASQIAAMAPGVSGQTGISSGKAQGILTGLARGAVPAIDLAQGATAAQNYSLASGDKLDKVQAQIVEIFNDPKKAAADLNESMRLLSATQTREVDDLVASGEAQKASELILNAFSDRARDAANSAGVLSVAMRNAAAGAGNFFGWMAKLVDRNATPPAQRLAQDNAYLKLYPSSNVSQPGDYAAVKAERDQLARQDAIDRTKAAQGAQQAGWDKAIEGAKKVADAYDVVAEKARKAAEAHTNLASGLSAARAEYAHYQAQLAKNPGNAQLAKDAATAKANVDQLGRALVNSANPNYRPGTGIPKGRKTPPIGADPFYRDAQTAQEQLDNAIKVAATDERDRDAVKAKLQAELEYQKNLLNPKAAPYAAKIRDAKIGEAGVAQDSRRRDALINAQQDAETQARVAAATDISTAAAVRETIAGQAHAAWLKGQINDETAYAAALQKRASAAAAAASATAIQSQRTANSGLGRIAGAAGNQADVLAAQRENEALAATQAERDNAASTVQVALAAKHLDQLRQELGLRDELNMKVASQEQDAGLEQQIALNQKEIQLMYASAEQRAKEIADLQTRNQLINKGYIIGSKAWTDEYNKRVALNQQIALQVATLSKQTANAQILDQLQTGLSAVAIAGLHGFTSLKQAAANFFNELGDLIIKLYIMKPLLNFLLGPDSAFGGLFGGGLATGGPVDANKFYLVGENGPEILGPGISGSIHPLKAPTSLDANKPAQAAPQQMTIAYAINVSGNGDKELLNRMQQVAQITVKQSIDTYDANAGRGLRGRLRAADKRAMF